MLSKSAVTLFLCACLLLPECLAQERRPDPSLVVQTGFSAYVSALALSPNGKLLAAGSWDKTIKLWDMTTGREIHSFTGHSFWVSSLAFSSDGRLLASCGDNKVRVWDVSAWKEVFSWEVGDEDVNAVSFSPDGKLLAGGSGNGHLRVWSLDTHNLVYVIKTRSAAVKAVAFSPDSSMLASGGVGGVVELWNPSTGNLLGPLSDSSRREIRSLAFSPDNSLLAAGSEGSEFLLTPPSINLWDIKARLVVRSLADHSATINAVAFSPDGRKLASGSDDMRIIIWDTVSGEQRGTLKGHFGHVTGVAFSPDGTRLVSSSGDMTIKLWDVNGGGKVTSLEGYSSGVNSVALSPDGRLLVSGNSGMIGLSKGLTNTVKVWDLNAGRLISTLKGADNMVTSISFDRSGRRLAAGDGQGRVLVWDARSGDLVRTLSLSMASVGAEQTSVTYSPDGGLLAGAGEEKLVKLWRASDGKLLKVLRGHNSPINAIAFSPDGRQLATGSGGITGSAVGDDRVRVWDVRSGRLLHTLSGHNNPIKAVAYSLDGELLASGSGDATVKVWQAGTGKLLRTVDNVSAAQNLQHSSAVNALAFCPGRILASGGDDGSINFWDANTGKLIRGRKGHTTDVKTLAFDASRRILVSGGDDGLVKFWNLVNYELISSLASLGDDGWVSVGPAGHFDTNKLENTQGIHWVLPDAPTDPLSLEIFMRDYYEPRLLPRMLGSEPLHSVPDLSRLNRAQPAVEITDVTTPNEKGEVQVTVEAKSTVSDLQRDESGPLESGVYDLRLFRDGQLVGYTTPAEAAATRDQSDSTTDPLALSAWRAANRVPLDGGKYTRAFTVRLPRLQGLSEVEFTAYAFNADRVKSATTSYIYKPSRLPPAVKGRAYVISVGVNAYEDEEWDLNFAVNDARAASEALTRDLTATGAYSEVVPVTLISDYEKDEGGRRIKEKSATKRNFKAVLDLLAGRTVSPTVISNIPGAGQLRRAEPEDLLLIALSSHGYTDSHGRFYLVPYDTGERIRYTPDGREIDPASLARFVSSDDLSEWLRDVDAGEMVMVIDTCHSASAVEQPGFKPGPMGSRGMGQLAYDKGMRVLAAAQADDVALELGRLKQGLLTYALIRDGLEKGKADKNRDGLITLAEWLDYGAERVPTLYGDVRAGRVSELKARDLKITAVAAGASVRRSVFQQPQLFDFKRKRREIPVAALRRQQSAATFGRGTPGL